MSGFETVNRDRWRAAVCLHGELDSVLAPQLFAELAEHLAVGRTVLRLDVSAVSFMDSTILSVLVTIDEQCRQAHGTMILTGAGRPVLRLLELTGTSGVLLVDAASREHQIEPGI